MATDTDDKKTRADRNYYLVLGTLFELVVVNYES